MFSIWVVQWSGASIISSPLFHTIVITPCTIKELPPPPKGIISWSANSETTLSELLGCSLLNVLDMIETQSFIYYCVLLPVPCQACGLLLPQLAACNIQQSGLNLDSSVILASIGNHMWTHAGQGYHCWHSATAALTSPLQNLHIKSIFVYSSWESSMLGTYHRMDCTVCYLTFCWCSYDYAITSTHAWVSCASVSTASVNVKKWTHVLKSMLAENYLWN